MPTTSNSGYSFTMSETVSSCVVLTTEEPAPWYLGSKAKSPIIAIFSPFPKGSVRSSFFKSTALSTAAFLAKAWWASKANSSFFPFAAAFVSRMAVSNSSTRSSISSSVISPLLSPSIRILAESKPGFGISRFEPAFTPFV